MRNQEITVFDASFNATSRYVYGPGIDDLIVWVDPNNSATKGYFHQDGHGSTLAETNGAGAVDSQYSYSGYGLPTTVADWSTRTYRGTLPGSGMVVPSVDSAMP